MSHEINIGVSVSSALRISVALLGFAFLLYAIPTLLFFFHHPVNSYIFPIALVMAIGAGVSVAPRQHYGNQWCWIIASLLIITISILVAGFMYDTSFDGMHYHQEIVAVLLKGWNPVEPTFQNEYSLELWTLHYAKAIEIIASVIVAFTGRIETGKAINLILTAGVTSGVYAFLRENPKNFFIRNSAKTNSVDEWGRVKCLLFSIAIVGSPVVCAQFLTFYIDFYKYIFLLYFLWGVCLITKGDVVHKRCGYVVLFIALILAMATKFNFFIEAGLWMIMAYIWSAINREWSMLRRLLAVSICALAAGAVLTWHPYFTNWIYCGHPLYPLMGDGAIDIMGMNTPEEYLHTDRFTNFIRSMLTPSIPNVDQRSGGFTILMPILLLASGWIGWKMRGMLKGVVWYVAICTLLSCFIFEQSWWARYISQLWLVGAIFLVVSQYSQEAGRFKPGYILLSLMMLAGGAALTYASVKGVIVGGYIRSLLDVSREKKVIVVGWLPVQLRHHLDENGVIYERRDGVPPGKENCAVYYHNGEEPIIVLSESQIKKLSRKTMLPIIHYERKKGSDI